MVRGDLCGLEAEGLRSSRTFCQLAFVIAASVLPPAFVLYGQLICKVVLILQTPLENLHVVESNLGS